MISKQSSLIFAIMCVVFVIYLLRKKKASKDKTGNVKDRQSLEKMAASLGIDKIFYDYSPPSPFCDDPSFARPLRENREANHAFRMLRMQYDTAIKRHNRVSAKIRRVNVAAKEVGDISGPEIQEVIDLCKKDIMDAPALVEYAKKWSVMQGSETIYYPTYESFKRLAVIYEKQGKYEEAIDVCEQAIRLGLDNYDPKVSLSKKRDNLIKLSEAKPKSSPYVDIDIVPRETKPTVPAGTVNGANTTREELHAYEIIRSMAVELAMQNRITYRDTKSYFAVNVDNNVRSWICRIKVESGPRWLTFHPLENGEEKSVRFINVEDIYQYRDIIVTIMKKYI